jgi:DNA polymerase-3 subunit epsilon
MVVNSATWKQAWVEIEPVLQGRVIGMYNAEFDLRLLKQSNLAAGLPWVLNTKKSFCVMNLYAAFYGEWNPRRNGFRLHKLENAGRACNITLPNTHHASDDAKLTAALFKYIANYDIATQGDH